MNNELHETVHDSKIVTVVEWADIVTGVLPSSRLTVRITPTSETARSLELSGSSEYAVNLMELMK